MKVSGGSRAGRSGATGADASSTLDPGEVRTRDQGDEYSVSGGSVRDLAKAPELPSDHRTAAELADAGALEDALDRLRRIADDGGRTPSERAAAAAWAGALVRRQRPADATPWLASAEALDPDGPLTRALQIEIAIDRGDVQAALDAGRAWAEVQPNEPLAHRALAEALIADANPKEALVHAERARDLTADPRTAAEHRILLTIAHAAAMANDPARLVMTAEASLRALPDDAQMHALAADYMLPNFASPNRKAIKARFERANRCYQAGDFEAVKEIALDILRIDPKDGLAHALYAIGARAAQMKRQPLVAAVDDTEKRHALIARLETVAARATLKGRPGRPSDLFPDWPRLNELQRATVAASALGYGKLLPLLIEDRVVYRFPLPGQSCVDREIDPHGDPSEPAGLGRFFYAVRGKSDESGLWAATGAEEIDRAAHGKYNTITHEIAHLVHKLLLRLFERREREEALSAELDALALVPLTIDARFREARGKRNDQLLVDGYSGLNVFEFFAQGMMSYLALDPNGPMTPAKLFARNPAFGGLAAKLAGQWSELPEACWRPPPTTNLPR
jgi:tetratricopeptide (TPR) repeat protein